MIDYPNKLNIIFDKLEYFNIKPIIIGGYIRDKLLKIDSKDIDIELYGVKSLDALELILQEFGDVNSVGKSFGVTKLNFDGLNLDFSLPREDSKHSKGHRGFSVKVDDSLDFKTATSRRDFTINAIGYDVQTQTLLDPFHGKDDLKNRLLRAVDLDKFGEDPLRVLRAVGFNSRFNFSLEPSLFHKCQAMVNDAHLKELPQERISLELQKMLLKSLNPSKGLELLKRLKIFMHFDTLAFHKRVDYFASHKTGLEKTDTLIFYALLYNEKSQRDIEQIIQEKALLKELVSFTQAQKSFNIENWGEYELYVLATQVNIEKFSYYLDAFYLGRKLKEVQTMRTKAKELKIFHEKAKPLLQGRDLIKAGLKPSTEFAKILNEAYQAQMKSLFTNHEEALVWLNNRL